MASKSNGHAIAKPNGKTANGQNTRVIIVRPSNMRARYDAAQTNDDNARHWANADSFGPNAALVPQVRRTLRGRCRYEVANNSYAKGIGLTIANDTVNIGPALQVLSADKPANKRFEMAIWRWMQAINLPEK